MSRIHRIRLSEKERKVLLEAGYMMLMRGLLLDREALKKVVEIRCAPLVDRWIDSGAYEADLLEYVEAAEAEAREARERRKKLAGMSGGLALTL